MAQALAMNASAADIEFANPDRRRLFLFAQKQRRDQISRDDEEDSYAQVREGAGYVGVRPQLGPVSNHNERDGDRAPSRDGIRGMQRRQAA